MIPPSKEMLSHQKFLRETIQASKNRGDTYSDNYISMVTRLEQLEKEFGNNWDGTVLEDDENYVELPFYIAISARDNDIKRILR